jgi:selenocysteine lyase/cysteine desulfurase
MELSDVRAEFPITERFAFLNHAGVSSYNRRASRAVQAHIEQAQTQPMDLFFDQLNAVTIQFKERVAMLIGAAGPGEIVEMPNVATGINTIAQSLPLRAGDNVLVLDGDYPANVYPWLNLAPKGVLVKWVPQHGGGLDLDRLAARIDGRTRAIALSTAMFATGFHNDMAAVGALCRQHDLFFVVDAIQTLGAFPLDVEACHIDFVACGSQKWLLSAPGSGFLYCRRERLPELQAGSYVGALSTVDPSNFLDYNFTLQPTADRFLIGTPNIQGKIALNATLELLLEIGPERIAERVLGITGVLIEDLQARGYRIVSNLQPQHRSGIVIVDVPNPQAAYERLLAANVVTSVRGGGLRVAPHFYNSEEDVLRVGEVLGNYGQP